MLSGVQIKIRGAVQGVGFRPFVYKLATSMKLTGWVLNSPQGVLIEADGEKDILENFIQKLGKDKPPISVIQTLQYEFINPSGFNSFEIKKSDVKGDPTAFVLPDIAICPDCLNDIFDINNRRYLYPFTNCTNCGPRFTIIESLPYDRSRTSMKNFIMCEECRSEYENPSDRRFHAQPNACPNCGPKVELSDSHRNFLSDNHRAVVGAADAIRSGNIVAVKGLGGFHLMCDARNDDVVKQLRSRKLREEKPFALMFPDLFTVEGECNITSTEEKFLISPQSPIVLLKKLNNIKSEISPFVAEKNPYLGVMLPYTPLHYILMRELKIPVVATSGNRSDEPICIDNYEASERLSGIADYFLAHNRPILRYADDSIIVVNLNQAIVYRRSRGYAPFPVTLNSDLIDTSYHTHSIDYTHTINTPNPQNPTNSIDPTNHMNPINPINSTHLIAVGAHLKNTIAYSKSNEVYISQHIGDLDTPESYKAFLETINDLKNIYNINPSEIICDYHPDYISSKYAVNSGLAVTMVQHHIAHIFSCMAENKISEPLLGVSWDGTGYGLNGTIWGGEFFLVKNKSVSRIGYLREFPLPGGEIAIKDIYRTAIGVLFEIFGLEIFESNEFSFLFPQELKNKKVLKNILSAKINSPLTSSAGRLFDAISSILNIRQRVGFEGQAAMELEFLTDGIESDEFYKFIITEDNSRRSFRIDWEPVIHQILTDKSNKISLNLMSVKFHNGLVEAITEMADKTGENTVLLSGGCFQNRYLLRKTVENLERKNFKVFFQKSIPPNDGGISLGQIFYKLSGYKFNGF